MRHQISGVLSSCGRGGRVGRGSSEQLLAAGSNRGRLSPSRSDATMSLLSDAAERTYGLLNALEAAKHRLASALQAAPSDTTVQAVSEDLCELLGRGC